MTNAIKAACAACAFAALIATTPAARADDFDVRMPVRYGFAYTNMTNAPEMSFSFGIDVDVLRVTPQLSFQLIADLESNLRPDLPDQDPLSSFGGFGFGFGLFYLTEGEVGIGADATAWFTFDAHDLVGGGFGARAYVYPFYMRMENAIKRDTDRMGAWVRSSLSLWVMARTDFTSDGNGSTFAFGASVDLLRIFFLPYLTLLTNKLR